MAKPIPIERRSLATQVSDALRELIMSNTYVRIQLSFAEGNRQRAHHEHIRLIDVRDNLLNHLRQHPSK